VNLGPNPKSDVYGCLYATDCQNKSNAQEVLEPEIDLKSHLSNTIKHWTLHTAKQCLSIIEEQSALCLQSLLINYGRGS